jgi:microcystin-dependent protein
MTSPFLGEIRAVSFNFAPTGWALCNGQLLPVNQWQALFALLGTTYGGNGTQNFGLPNLQARIPLHAGNGYQPGQQAGEATHTLVNAEMPTHTHTALGDTSAASQVTPTGYVMAQSAKVTYGPALDSPMNPASVLYAGGGLPHNNLPPYLVLNYIIALVGIFPSRN